MHQLLGGACRAEVGYFALPQGDTAEDLLAAPDITPQQGKLSAAVPARPGLGCALNWDAIERAAVRYSRT